jgi:hypothetical protein
MYIILTLLNQELDTGTGRQGLVMCTSFHIKGTVLPDGSSYFLYIY